MTDPLAAARRADRSTLTEPEAKTLLREAGFAVPDGRVVDSVSAAGDAAATLGYPVVVKVCAAAVTHKSEWGGGAGVALGLESRDAVEAAAERVFAAAESAGVDARVLVERAVTGEGVECIVGGVRDPSFGPTVLVGLGGTFVELFEDVAHRVAPVDRPEAHSMLDDLQAGPLLDGYRGGPTVDRGALVDAVVAVGDLLVEYDDLHEVECNPVLATDEGVVALDALATLEGDR
jgi:acyl-CoA synthetase (NDP forming)